MNLETLVVTTERTTLDLLLFRRFKREVAGLVEATLAVNPGLASRGPYLPVGTSVATPAPAPAQTVARPLVSLYD